MATAKTKRVKLKSPRSSFARAEYHLKQLHVTATLQGQPWYAERTAAALQDLRDARRAQAAAARKVLARVVLIDQKLTHLEKIIAARMELQHFAAQHSVPPPPAGKNIRMRKPKP